MGIKILILVTWPLTKKDYGKKKKQILTDQHIKKTKELNPLTCGGACINTHTLWICQPPADKYKPEFVSNCGSHTWLKLFNISSINQLYTLLFHLEQKNGAVQGTRTDPDFLTGEVSHFFLYDSIFTWFKTCPERNFDRTLTFLTL